MPSIVERVLQKKADAVAKAEAARLLPSTVTEPDRTTFYCDVQARSFRVGCCKILEHYANGDCRVLTRSGVQFTARAEEVFHIRKGDYHEQEDL